jgi:hypothetical protein
VVATKAPIATVDGHHLYTELHYSRLSVQTDHHFRGAAMVATAANAVTARTTALK